jgi:Protein of unknown function (DUF2442)
MRSLAVEPNPRAHHVECTEDELVVYLLDGRTISVPLAWFPRLLHATREQRSMWELLGDREGIHWPQLDEDLSVAGLLRGTPAPQPNT